MGRTEFLTPTIRSEPWVGKRKPTKRAKWRSFYECMQECAQNLVDTADIVRDGDISPRERYYGSVRSPGVSALPRGMHPLQQGGGGTGLSRFEHRTVQPMSLPWSIVATHGESS